MIGRRTAALLAALIVTLATAPLAGQAAGSDWHWILASGLFDLESELFNDCAGVPVLIRVNEAAAEAGLADAEELETLARIHLGSSRIYSDEDDGSSLLYIGVNATSGRRTRAWLVEVEFWRTLANPDLYGHRVFNATAWEKESFGYTNPAQLNETSWIIKDRISSFLYAFVSDYLVANELRCWWRSPEPPG